MIFQLLLVLSFFAKLISTSNDVDNFNIDYPTICQQIEHEFSVATILPSDPQYQNISHIHWSQTSWKTPFCIFQPDCVEDLQKVIPRLVAENVQFAIRSGGHMTMPGAANIDRGVLIDLQRLDKVEYNAERNVVVIGTGQRWKNVYTQLDRYNVTVVGGRVLDIGVGGLVLGSGLSYLSDLYGLACDNVVNFEVVLADGSVVNANSNSNSELFWALRGGSNNFGIVTAMTLYTYPIHQVWGGVKGYTLDEMPALFDAMLEYQSLPNKDPYANIMLQGFPTNASIGILLNMVYLKPIETPPAFAAFYNITTTFDTTKTQTLTEFLSGQASVDIPRIDTVATSFKPTAALYKRIQEIITTSSSIKTIKSVTAGSQAFGIQPITTSLVEAGRRMGGNALGLECVNQTWLVLDSGWWSSNDDMTVHNAARDMIGDIDSASKSGGDYVEYIFMNDASWDQEVIRHYGAENVQRLKRVSELYDPNCVFQRLVPGGYKLP
ncbi:hypothetical protein HYALB_00013102 [Hymenoscyphus albidus]|uniref:FAD-binding PCMH-type domain-containing protein n=1 Tax=Hymenoscyphus albidus TaxID=595503 RepID=A0A9N9LXR0_9HELO|nr:hypothetical protein HYALB_00013102 [Hymenoscyphus albidus]